MIDLWIAIQATVWEISALHFLENYYASRLVGTMDLFHHDARYKDYPSETLQEIASNVVELGLSMIAATSTSTSISQIEYGGLSVNRSVH